MKKITMMACGLAMLAMASCGNKTDMENPFFAEWNTPYGIPPFEQIKTEHYMPAFEEGMARQNANIEAIVNNKEAATFENTIEAMEYSGELLNTVSGVFFNLQASSTNDAMDSIAEIITPKLSAHSDDIMLNAKLFERVKSVYDQRENLQLEGEQARLLEETYKDFVRGGANIPEEKQARFREVNSQLASLGFKFGSNLLKATNDYSLVLTADEVKDLGLTDGQLAAAKDAAGEDGKYKFTLQIPSWEPFMMNCNNRDLRKQMWDAYTSRCNGGKYDNTQIIDSMVNLRLERAQILGYESHAAYVLEDCLAKTPQAVYDCLMQLWTPALNKAKGERDEYQKMIVADLGAGAKLEPWDWRYYSEKLRMERYALNDEEIRPYFSLDSVRQGAFNVAHKLYGIDFVENPELPTYDKEAISYEVKEGDKTIAILYMDFFPRASKGGGAWMTNFREQYVDQNGENQIPIIQVVTNFTKPTGDKPSLLNFDESTTLFHEFGHAIHGMLSKCHYRSISGTNVPRDFVELPSQVMENWCREPQVMKEFAHHYQTGEVIPDALIKKIEAAATYGQGFINTELLAASLLDMDYYTLTKPTKIEYPAFEDQSMAKIGLIPEIISRYKSPYFSHIFDGGYSAGYYSYTWTAILDADAYEAFKESGDLYNPELAKKFRHILESGNTQDLMELYRAFRGKDPSVEPLLRNRGLSTK